MLIKSYGKRWTSISKSLNIVINLYNTSECRSSDNQTRHVGMFGLKSCFFLGAHSLRLLVPRGHLQPLSHPPLPTPPVLLHHHLLRQLLLRYLHLQYQRHKLFCLLDAWCLAREKRDADAGEIASSSLKLGVAWSCLKLEIKKSFRKERLKWACDVRIQGIIQISFTPESRRYYWMRGHNV